MHEHRETHSQTQMESLSRHLRFGDAEYHSKGCAHESLTVRGQGSARWSRGPGPGPSSSEGLGGPGGSAARNPYCHTRLAPRRGHPEDLAWLSGGKGALQEQVTQKRPDTRPTARTPFTEQLKGHSYMSESHLMSPSRKEATALPLRIGALHGGPSELPLSQRLTEAHSSLAQETASRTGDSVPV